MHGDEIPEGMEIFKIPASRYAVFTHKGDVKKVDHTVNFIYSNWLLESGEYYNYGPDLEIYDDKYIPGSDDSIMYYGIPIL